MLTECPNKITDSAFNDIIDPKETCDLIPLMKTKVPIQRFIGKITIILNKKFVSVHRLFLTVFGY